MGKLGNYYTNQYAVGNRDVIAPLTAEEPNLLHARRLARVHGWRSAVINTMQGLRMLYDHTGRRAEWKRLVEEIVPDFVDPATDLLIHGREEHWGLVTEYRMRLAYEARQWDESERLQRLQVSEQRKNATPFLTLPPESLNDSQKDVVRTLASSLHDLGEIQRELGQAECVKAYEESLTISERIGHKTGAASCALNLGHAYLTLPALRGLAEAEKWYQRSLDLSDERDRLWRGKCHGQLGLVSYLRFQDTRKANAPNDELLKHLNNAVRLYHQALDLLPPNVVDDLVIIHGQLGNIYRDAGEFDQGLHHYRKSINYAEAGNNFYEAGRYRFNAAVALAQAGRLSDAREYAYAALRNYEQYGEATKQEQEETRGLIGEIEKVMKNDK